MTQADLAAEVAELQTQLAFQEDVIERLDGALAAQQQEILDLRRQLEWLRERQRALETQDPARAASPADEKPPHY